LSWNGRVLRKDTTLFFTSNPHGGITVEAESPGTLSEQRPFFLADYRSNHLAYNLLDAFFGLKAFDPLARFDIGACFLYFANGFTFDKHSNDNRRIEPSMDLLRKRHEVFDSGGTVHMDTINSDGTVNTEGLKALVAERKEVEARSRNEGRVAQVRGGVKRDSSPLALPLASMSISGVRFGVRRDRAPRELPPSSFWLEGDGAGGPAAAFRGLFARLANRA
jgi:hypothetical protein